MTINHKTSKLNFEPQEKLGKHLENNEAEQIISELVFACQDCFFNSKTEKELHEHTKEKHTLACKSCLYVCKNEKDLNEHTMLKHNFECNKCKFSSKNEKYLKENVVEKHTFNCKECSYVNSSKSKVDQHEKVAHNASQTQQEQCIGCDKKLDIKSDTKTNCVIYFCINCSVELRTPDHIKHMFQNDEKSLPDRIYICGECKFSFYLRGEYDEHNHGELCVQDRVKICVLSEAL